MTNSIVPLLMTLRLLNTDDAPKAVGPYSQAVQAGDFIFLSGQIPIDPKTQEVNLFADNAAEQARLVLNNIKALLESQGLQMKQIVKTSIFLTNMNDFAAVNEVYAAAFEDHRPARSCVEVSRLPKGVAVEIEAFVLL